MIEELIKNKEPFAVVQYFEWLKASKNEKSKVYEIMTYNKKRVLKNEELASFKENIGLFVEVLNTKDGKVWEFMEFEKNKLCQKD